MAAQNRKCFMWRSHLNDITQATMFHGSQWNHFHFPPLSESSTQISRWRTKPEVVIYVALLYSGWSVKMYTKFSFTNLIWHWHFIQGCFRCHRHHLDFQTESELLIGRHLVNWPRCPCIHCSRCWNFIPVWQDQRYSYFRFSIAIFDSEPMMISNTTESSRIHFIDHKNVRIYPFIV